LITFEGSCGFFEAAGAVAKIGSSLNRTPISRFCWPKSMEHTVDQESKSKVKTIANSPVFLLASVALTIAFSLKLTNTCSSQIQIQEP
jgi:hypothetical protein